MRHSRRRIDITDIADPRLLRTHHQQRYRRVGGEPVRPLLARALTTTVAPTAPATHPAAEPTDTLGTAEGMESGRIYDRIDQVATALRPFDTEPAVAAFLARAERHLRQRGR